MGRRLELFGNGEAQANADATPYERAIERLDHDDLVAHWVQLYTRVAQLESALKTRIIIEQAKGVLAARLHMRIDDAFQVLRLGARSSRMRIHDLSQRVVEEPATPQPITRALARQARWRAAAQREHYEAIRERYVRIRTAHDQQTGRLRSQADDFLGKG
jgi:uncharacterized protein (DUF2267 family)